MQFHVAQNGEKTGPFERDEVYRRLVAGEFKPTDLGWHEGLNEWEPLSKLIPPQTPPIPASGSPVFGPMVAQVQAVPAPPSSGLATASLVCGILSFFTLGLSSIPAIITGHVARSRIKKSAGALGGGGMAVAGLITGYLGFFILFIAVSASLAMPMFARSIGAGREVQLMSAGKQLIIGMKLYAAEHDGKFPPTLESLVEEKIIEDRKLLETSSTEGVAQPQWDYRGAGLSETSPADSVVLVSRRAYSRKKVIGHLDGRVESVRESEVP